MGHRMGRCVRYSNVDGPWSWGVNIQNRPQNIRNSPHDCRISTSTTVAYYIFSPDAKWPQPLDVTAATETMPRRPLRGVVSRTEAWREAA